VPTAIRHRQTDTRGRSYERFRNQYYLTEFLGQIPARTENQLSSV